MVGRGNQRGIGSEVGGVNRFARWRMGQEDFCADDYLVG